MLADGVRGIDLDVDDVLEDFDKTFDTSELKSVISAPPLSGTDE